MLTICLLSTSTSRFPVRNFFTVFGSDLLDIIFSIKKKVTVDLILYLVLIQ